MIRRQPDIIVARLSSLDRIPSVPTTIEGRSKERVPRDLKTQCHLVVDIHHQDPVMRKDLCWTSSPSWIAFLLGSLIYHKRHVEGRRRNGSEIKTKYTLPTWLVRRTLDLRLNNFAGWQANLRTYRTLSGSDDFFLYASSGDVDGLRRLLSTRRNLVTDRESDHGQTALHVSNIVYINSLNY